ncbi:isomerase [Streptomyces hyaluromycini]|uniref:Isomerase n=1 Tax=Streptomyces hyaluromycini TaxID=1377993 RepID=A0ABV1WXZ6_9ACTN
MPLILVDYSSDLDFDHQGFAKELHPLITEVIDATVADCKTVFRPAAQYTVGDGGPDAGAVVLVQIKLLEGRSVERRAELTTRIAALLQRYLSVPAALAVEITELERATYRVLGRTG